jgi:hypothetical protein
MGSVLKSETWSYVDGWPLPVRYRLSPGIGRTKHFGLTALAEKWLGAFATYSTSWHVWGSRHL